MTNIIKNKPKVAIIGHVGHHKTLASKILIENLLSKNSCEIIEIKEEEIKEEIFTIENYRVSPLISISLYGDKPSNNALKRCTKGLHLYNSENECVICNKSINHG